MISLAGENAPDVLHDRHANIALLQCTRVVQPIAHHHHGVARPLQCRHKFQFVHRRLVKTQRHVLAEHRRKLPALRFVVATEQRQLASP